MARIDNGLYLLVYPFSRLHTDIFEWLSIDAFMVGNGGVFAIFVMYSGQDLEAVFAPVETTTCIVFSGETLLIHPYSLLI